MRSLSVRLPGNTLLAIYKSFVRLYLDCGYILYDKPNNGHFINKVGNVPYKACLAITDATQGTSREKS